MPRLWKFTSSPDPSKQRRGRRRTYYTALRKSAHCILDVDLPKRPAARSLGTACPFVRAMGCVVAHRRYAEDLPGMGCLGNPIDEIEASATSTAEIARQASIPAIW